jgi:TolB-like protein
MSGEEPESGASPPPTDPPAAVQVPNASIHVFISYASQDATVAAALVEALERHGVKCWIAPRDVKAGAQYADAIVRAISGAKAIVLVLSESGIASSHVGKEIERASSKKRPIIALRIDAAPLTPALEYFLSESQWVEAQTGSMEAAYAKLIDDIRDPARTAPRNTPAVPGQVSAATGRAARPKLRFSWILLAVGTVFVLALAALMVDKFWISGHVAQEKPDATTSLAPAAAVSAQPTISEKSVAVLPFLDMSEKKDQEYFSDGLSEELIDMLTKIPELRVPARTSSFYFKGKQSTVHDIAKALSVAHVLEGSVRKSGNRLRITAQLVRADSGYHLWSETYDRQLDDIFKVQDEIASAVVKALKSKLLPARQLESGHRTDNSEAYDQYLFGKESFNRSSPDGDRLAVSAYLRAIALDANFAAAYAGLAEAEAALADTETGERAALQRALEAADRAVALAPDAPYGYAVRSWLRGGFFWDWSGARADIEKAIAHDAGDGRVQLTYSELLRSLGLIPEAIAAARKATDADPLSEAAWVNLGYVLMNDRQFAAARQAQNRAQQINPESIWPRYRLAQIALLDGHPEMAITIAQTNRNPAIVTALAAYSLGRREEAQRALNELISRHAQNLAYQIAEAYAWRGETDQAFEWLDRSYAQHDAGLSFVKTDLFLGRIRADRRFAAMLRKMNLPE